MYSRREPGSPSLRFWQTFIINEKWMSNYSLSSRSQFVSVFQESVYQYAAFLGKHSSSSAGPWQTSVPCFSLHYFLLVGDTDEKSLIYSRKQLLTELWNRWECSLEKSNSISSFTLVFISFGCPREVSKSPRRIKREIFKTRLANK